MRGKCNAQTMRDSATKASVKSKAISEDPKCVLCAAIYILLQHSNITLFDFHFDRCHPLAVIGGQPAGEVLPRTTRRLLPAETRCPADSDVR